MLTPKIYSWQNREKLKSKTFFEENLVIIKEIYNFASNFKQV
jgi:hypothetical protein